MGGLEQQEVFCFVRAKCSLVLLPDWAVPAACSEVCVKANLSIR